MSVVGPVHAELPPGGRDAYVARVVEVTNVERQKAGLALLSVSPELSQAAQSYAEVLATSRCFAHTCGTVPDMAQRDERAGYVDWTALGENIAAGFPTPEGVVAGWMASPGHRANILNPAYTQIGVGVASVSDRFGTYATQEFGTRRNQVPAFQPVITDSPVGAAGPDAVDEEPAPEDEVPVDGAEG